MGEIGEGAALVTYRTRVPEKWVDYNGHLNVAYYMLAFDRGTDALAEHVGIGQSYLRATGNSFYIVEAHLVYEREVLLGAPIRIESQLIAADDKRLHFVHAMIEEAGGYRAATAEMLGLHIDLSARRAAPFPPEPRARLEAMAAAHANLPRPAQLGRGVALRRKAQTGRAEDC